MTYEEFKNNMVYELNRRAGELGKVMTTTEKENNGQMMEFLYLKRKDMSVSPKVCIKQVYDACTSGECIGTILKRVLAEMTVNVADLSNDLMTSWYRARSYIYPKLINTKLNAEFLKGVPHTELLDLSVIYYMEIEGVCSGNKAYGIINNKLFDRWAISLQRLHEASRQNFKKDKPALLDKVSAIGMYSTHRLENMIKDFMGKHEIYMLSCEDRRMGASYMLIPEVLEHLRSLLDEDIIVLPSSIDDLVILRKSLGMPPEEMREMAKSVNRTHVEPENVLSESIYEYSGGELKIIA